MYSQQELDEAVAAGAIDATAAASLRNYFGGDRSAPAVDEEQFRLINSFNDIFVSIASAILLFAVGWIGQAIGGALNFVVDDRGPSPLPRLRWPRSPGVWRPSSLPGAAWRFRRSCYC